MGYRGPNAEVWDSRAAAAAQAAHDAELQVRMHGEYVPLRAALLPCRKSWGLSWKELVHLSSRRAVPSWLTRADHDVQGLAVRLAELLAEPSPSGSAAAAQSAGASAAGGSAGPAPVARDPVEAISQSVLIPMLMQELNQATFTGMPASCLLGVFEHRWTVDSVHAQMNTSAEW